MQRVIAELEAHGISEDEIYAKGLTIQTTIDRKAQAAAISAIHQTFSGLTKQQRNMKNALVAVRPQDGAVLAYYGGPNGNELRAQEGLLRLRRPRLRRARARRSSRTRWPPR